MVSVKLLIPIIIGLALSNTSSAFHRVDRSNLDQLDRNNKHSVKKLTECKDTTIVLHEGDDVVVEFPGYNSPFQPQCNMDVKAVLKRKPQEFEQYLLHFDETTCNNGKVSIEEDAGDDGTKVVGVCDGDKIITDEYQSHEHMVIIKYSTQETCSNPNGCGARIVIKAVYVCGGPFTADNGAIVSPYYPGNYGADLACTYDVRAPPGYKVEMTCDDFNLSEKCSGNKSCKSQTGEKTFFKVLTSAPEVAYEGNSAKGMTFSSKHSHMIAYFLSNDNNDFSGGPYGFKCNYKFIPQ